MYIIEEGKAYLIDGEVGYQINFGIDGKMLVDKEKTINIKDKVVYSFEEMYAKLNIAYKIEEAKQKNALNNVVDKEVEKLKETISQLEKENEELKKQLESLEKVNISLDVDVDNEKVVEQIKETKKEKK